MATEGLLQIRHPITATADLSAARYHFVTLAGALAGAGALGFMLEDNPGNGEEGTILLVGKGKVTAGGAISAGDAIASDASGQAVVAATGDIVLGVALEAAVSGDVFQFLAGLDNFVDTV